MSQNLLALDSSRLNRRIRFQQRNPDTTTDSVNEDISPWIDVPDHAEVWADVQQRSADQFVEGDVEYQSEAAVFLVRWRDDISIANRIIWNEQNYKIVGVILVGRRAGLALHSELQEIDN